MEADARLWQEQQGTSSLLTKTKDKHFSRHVWRESLIPVECKSMAKEGAKY